MGTLKPGAIYIYEKADGVTYAREIGSTYRQEIGWDYDVNKVSENLLWADIRDTAKDHPALQNLLDKVILMYRLIKDNPA